jgi:hypothetical protein
MNNPKSYNWNIAVSFSCLALLMFASNASAALTVTTANQQGAANVWPFTPTWVVNTNASLINGLVPTIANGNFTREIPGRSSDSLTLNTNLTINQVAGTSGNTSSTNYVTVGQSGGTLLVYTLPTSANGYNLTNITVEGGWANNGRDMLSFTVLYSTVDNPASFTFLTNVVYNPTVPGSTPSATQAIITDSLGGVIAGNVAAIEFDFTFPGVENGFGGLAAITVGGLAATSVFSPVISLTTSNQTGASPFTPTWTPESQDLITGLAPTTANGNFNQETSGGTPVLTDAMIGQSGTVSTFATCGSSGGSLLTYTLTNTVNGSDVTNIVVYSGWGDGGRDGQYYDVSYSTIAAPTTFIPVTTVYYNPQGTSGASANRVSFAMSDGSPLASGVANLRFSFNKTGFNNGFDNNYCGISEIIVQGRDTAAPPPPPSPVLTQDTLPAYAETVVGDRVIFTAAFSNAPPATLQWQVISTNGTTTNDVPGATSATLTLSNVQLANSGSYRLKAVNATNGVAAPSYSTAAALLVGNVPAPVNNVIMNYAGENGLGAAGTDTNFFPTWTIDTNNDLILGSVIGVNSAAGSGNFGLGPNSLGDPTILSDGDFGYFTYWPNVGSSPTEVSCGPGGGAGTSMTYTLNTSSATNGFDLTNITVYGGWGDHGRDEQKYQVLYSTVAAPTTFLSLGTFDYNPTDPNNAQSATRTTLVPATGVLAANVYAVEVNWNLQGSQPKNGWEGYSEVLIKGAPSAPKAVLTQDITPLTADDVVGSSLTITAGFSGATGFQWQKNGTNISGATSPTLTLNNLQLSDTATNGGYSLIASNASGISITRACKVTVNPAPTPVGNRMVTIAHQTSDAGSFSPTWDTSSFSSSLITGAFPFSTGTGNFNDPDGNPVSQNLAGGLPVLTDGDYGSIVTGGTHPAFATCGDDFHNPPAGQFVVYALPSSPNGYDLTNIMMASGWNDLGRDADWGTIYFATAQNPTVFFPIATITNNPSTTDGFANGPTVIRATVTAASGVLATNAAYVMVDFRNPPGVPNNYSGISQINVFGSPSATAYSGPVMTAQNEIGAFDWVVETPNLIANQLPSSTGPGVFTEEGCNETNLTDGVIGFGAAYGASCGDDGVAVPWIIFTPTNSATWNLTNIVVYTLWHDYGRDGQFYNLSYSTVSDPNTFIPLASVNYNPDVPTDGTPSGNRVQISPPLGQSLLASNVAAVKFDFSPQGPQDFAWSGYSEIVLQGTNGPLTVAHAPVLGAPGVSGGNLILAGSGGTSGAHYTVLTTTNLTAPVNWTTNGAGNLDNTGSFSNTVPITTTPAARFFRVRLP